MNNFQSYQTYQGPIDEPTPQGVSIRIHEPVHSVTTIDGVITQATHQREAASSAEVNPFHGTDSFAATATNPNGLPVYALEPTTLVTIDGVQAPVQFWVSEGRLQKAPDGTYTESTAQPQEATKADPNDYLTLPPQAIEAVDRALEGIDPGYADTLTATAVGVVSGSLDINQLHQTFGQISGLDGEARDTRIATVLSVYQTQADVALTKRFGVGEADLQGFYDWARQNQRGRLAETVTKQIHSGDVSGYRVLAEQWKASNPPSVAALKAAGFNVRPQGIGTDFEVWASGQWMSRGAAARAGLI